VERRAELVPVMAAWMLERTTAQWVALLEPHAVPCAPILSIPDALAHPQVVARGMRVETGGIPMVATPMRFDGVRPVAPLAPPQLDEHGDAIRQALAQQAGWPSP
jgi:crotonobetainyl-CoA:carnitine CoA-transferase CaiB-like acyl-CoA transferase